LHYLFAGFSLDTDRRELRRGDGLLRLEPKAFDLLVYLIANRERVVSKDDLLAAVWNGRIVSESALTTCINAVRKAIGDNGKMQRRIKTLQRKGFRFVAGVREERNSRYAGVGEISPDASKPALALPDKPSIAVLPFANLSGNPEQEYAADGIVQDIITELSRIPSLFVIARNSSFAYKGKTVDIRQIGRELGVRYLLEGSVRKAGSRLRITGQLVEAETGVHLWADRFDSVLEEVFELQDRVTMAVAGAIEPSVTQAEIRRANRKPTKNLQAYDWLLRARGEQQLFSRDGFDRAMQMARRALELDPRYAQAYGSLVSWISFRRTLGWMQDEEAESAEGVRLAHLAVQLAPNDPTVLTEAGVAIANLAADQATALAWFDRAIALNPNSAHAFGRGAVVRYHAGDYATAIDHADRAMRLSPFDYYSFLFSFARGASHFHLRQLPEAMVWLSKAAHQNPQFTSTYVSLGSALAHAGRMEEARVAIRRLLELHPADSMTWRRQRRLLSREEDFERIMEGARLAGLPE